MSRGYADDLAMVMYNIWAEAPSVALLFELVASISNLKLNGKKCVIIPLWKFSAPALKKLLRELLPLWRDFHVEDQAKYLGDTIGPGSNFNGWVQALGKYLQRCRIVGSSGLSFISRCVLCKMLACSVVQFHGQFRMPPSIHRAIERKGLFTSIGGPFNAYPVNFLFTLKESKVFPVSFPSMQVLSVAAQARVILETVPHWRDYYNMVEEAMTSLDARLIPSYPHWFGRSVVWSLHQTDRILEQSRIMNNGHVIDISVRDGMLSERKFKLQRCVYNSLLPSLIKFSLHKYLLRKFTRWYSREVSESYAHQAIRVLHALHGRVPPCVLHALFTTWTNAWCTDRRFQQDLRDCVLSPSCRGKDEIEHYLICTHGFSMIRSKLRLPTAPNNAAHSMLLSSRVGDDTVLSAVSVYAVRGVVHKMRALNQRASNVQKHLWEQVRVAALYSSTLKEKLGTLWANS